MDEGNAQRSLRECVQSLGRCIISRPGAGSTFTLLLPLHLPDLAQC